jgi:hypothetical protein
MGAPELLAGERSIGWLAKDFDLIEMRRDRLADPAPGYAIDLCNRQQGTNSSCTASK